MAQLRQSYQKYQERDAEIIAIGPEGPEEFTGWWHSHDMPFTGIPDPEHTVADMYGQQVNLLKLGRMPATLVIDKEGVIRHAHYGGSMKDVSGDEELLDVLDGLK